MYHLSELLSEGETSKTWCLLFYVYIFKEILKGEYIMSKTFEGMITKLSEESNYNYDFLVILYTDLADTGGNVDWYEFAEFIIDHKWDKELGECRGWDDFITGMAMKYDYDIDFLVDKLEECFEEGDILQFIAITVEHDW